MKRIMEFFGTEEKNAGIEMAVIPRRPPENKVEPSEEKKLESPDTADSKNTQDETRREELSESLQSHNDKISSLCRDRSRVNVNGRSQELESSLFSALLERPTNDNKNRQKETPSDHKSTQKETTPALSDVIACFSHHVAITYLCRRYGQHPNERLLIKRLLLDRLIKKLTNDNNNTPPNDKLRFNELCQMRCHDDNPKSFDKPIIAALFLKLKLSGITLKEIQNSIQTDLKAIYSQSCDVVRKIINENKEDLLIDCLFDRFIAMHQIPICKRKPEAFALYQSYNGVKDHLGRDINKYEDKIKLIKEVVKVIVETIKKTEHKKNADSKEEEYSSSRFSL